ncbi:MAG: lysine biosynthesis protein LysW [Acidobacteriota bacterium]|nr:lysine biosynthesis protein LysW [Acidobacteriota bacterium]MDH3528612.1 lysine biosynthesis protein LysW [Acidobacteriota bacterium]
MPSARCPVCEGRVFVDASTEMGEIVFCDDCESNLELVGLDPFELDPASEANDEVDDGFSIFDEADEA